MLSDAYQASALKTESNDMQKVVERLQNPKVARMLHAAMGIATEAGELLDILKKHIFYGKELDEDKIVHFMEELGDVQWYIAIGADSIGLPMSTVLERNIDKLSVRYSKQFKESEALQRNLKAEAATLGHSQDYSDVEMNPNE
jgi:NTP pyrophosphatase (non-canonical NTP hydrolase)